MKIVNRKARHDYTLFEKIQAGIVLNGAEVKSVREGKMSLDDAFVKIRNGEAWLFNCHIHPYRFADIRDLDPKRVRKVLLRKNEIISLETKMKQKRLILVPVACYNQGRRLKIDLVLARGKREFEKREDAKKKTIQKETEQEIFGDD